MDESQENDITLHEIKWKECPNEIKLYQVEKNDFIGTILLNPPDAFVYTVIILDRSDSMVISAGDQTKRMINKILPLVFKKLSYPEHTSVYLITFASDVEDFTPACENFASFPITAGGSTYMSGAVEKLCTLLLNKCECFYLNSPVRVLTISAGAVNDLSETETAAAELMDLIENKGFSINSQAVRLFTSENQPDTKAVCSLLRINNTTTSQLADIEVHQTDDEIATSIAQLFQSDNFTKSAHLEYENSNILKFPWYSQPSTQLVLFPGLNIFWLRIAEVPMDKFFVNIMDHSREEAKVSVQETLTLTTFHDLMEAKRSFLLDHIKFLNIVGTNWAKKRVETILNYFRTNEERLAEMFPTSSRFRISFLLADMANDEMMKDCTDSKVMAQYVRGEIQPKRVKPQIDRTNLNTITERAGNRAELNIDVQGESTPTITWSFGSKKIDIGGDPHVENENHHTRLIFLHAERQHTGTYKIFAENASGTDEATMELLILDRPKEPIGPLVVSNVTKNCCKVEWQKPDDDGGLPLTGYVVERMDDDIGSWVSYSTQKTEYFVSGLELNHQYHFRVKAINDIGESSPLNSNDKILARDPFDCPAPPASLEMIDWNENSVKLQWEPPNQDGGAPITCYIIETAEGSGNFVKSIEIPGEQRIGSVSDLVEGQQYTFCVKAVNTAGPSEPSQSTNVHTVKARFFKPTIDRINLKSITELAGKPIKFDVDIHGKTPAKITSTYKDKETTNGGNGSLENINRNSKLTLLDTKRDHSENTSDSDQSTIELFIKDRPTEPIGPLDVLNVTKNSCTLKWQKPKDDGGSPLTGYVVEVEKIDNFAKTSTISTEINADKTEFNVTDLEEHYNYRFHVKAVNKEGQSLPLHADHIIMGLLGDDNNLDDTAKNNGDSGYDIADTHNATDKPEIPQMHCQRRSVVPDTVFRENIAPSLAGLKKGFQYCVETGKKFGPDESINSKHSLDLKVPTEEDVKLGDSIGMTEVNLGKRSNTSFRVVPGISKSTMVMNVVNKVNEMKRQSFNRKGPKNEKESDLKLYPLAENEFIATVWLGKDEILNSVETVIIINQSLSMKDEANRLTNDILPLVLSKLSNDKTQSIHLLAFAKETKYFYVTTEQMKSLKIKWDFNGNLMEPAVKILRSIFDGMNAKTPVRMLTICDGEVQDREEAEVEAANLMKEKSHFTINSHAVRLFTSKNQPDTQALCSMLQMNNTTRPCLIDIATEETNETIATTIAQLFKSDNFTRCKNLSMEKQILLKCPWYSQPLSQIILLPGWNIFWLTKYPTDEVTIGKKSSLKVVEQEPVTLTKFQDLVKIKLTHILDHIKMLKVIGTYEAIKRVDQILKYFETTEDKLAQELQLPPEFLISSVLTRIANDEKIKNCTDSALMANYLRRTESGIAKIQSGKVVTKSQKSSIQSEKASSSHHSIPEKSFVQTINIHDPTQVSEDLLEKGQVQPEQTSSSDLFRHIRNLKFDRNCIFYLSFVIIFILISIIIFHCRCENRNTCK